MFRHDSSIVRRVVLLAAIFSTTFAFARGQDDVPRANFEFETVRRLARVLATNEFADPNQDALPEALAKLSYDQFREVRFRPDHALWRADSLPFTAQFFHRGYLYRPRVAMHVLTADGVADVPFDPGAFDYPKDAGVGVASLPGDLGFAGFRLHAPINRPDYFDEVVAFLGASYFRPIAKGQVYGSSARGLAIDTADPHGEEFPLFREFWIEHPKASDASAHVFALLDSKSVAGAYEFVITPGADTRVHVRAELFARRDVKKLGFAPLTSMFLFGENRTRAFDDFRPEVHDCDGLLVDRGGVRTWRALDNPERTHRVTKFEATNLRGFGLMQRDRAFDSYEDLESRFEQRPSLWVEPRSGFDAGRVELVEIPTQQEVFDNVVAYFVPNDVLRAGGSRAFEYDLFATSGDPAGSTTLHVASTRIHRNIAEDTSLFVIEFAGEGALSGALPTARVEAARGAVRDVVLQPNPVRGTLRLTFRYAADGDDSVELRAELRRGDVPASETWVHPWGKP